MKKIYKCKNCNELTEIYDESVIDRCSKCGYESPNSSIDGWADISWISFDQDIENTIDQIVSDHDLGLYKKYTVIRNDNSEKHKNCQYFVIDINHDKFAEDVLKYYAYLCELEYPHLSRDLKNLFKGEE